MSRSCILAVSCSVACIALPIASIATDWGASVGGGAAFPWASGSTLEGVSSGTSVTLGASLRFGATDLVLRLVQASFARNTEGVLLRTGLSRRAVRVIEVRGGAMRMRGVGLELRYFPTQSRADPHRPRITGARTTHPYALGAIGLSTYRYERVEISYQFAGHTWPSHLEAESGTHVGAAVGAGAELLLTRRWSLILECRYEQTLRPGNDLRVVPLRVELHFET